MEEGGVFLDLHVDELLGYGEASGEAFKCLVSAVQQHLQLPMRDQVGLEYCGLSNSPDDGVFIHAVLFFISPSTISLSSKDIELLESIKDMTYIVPIICKADTYTVVELKERKAKLRYELGLIGLTGFPLIADDYYTDIYQQINAKWPLSVISSTQVINNGQEGLIRARSYPWGHINIDDDRYNDLGLLQHIMFNTLHTKLKLYVRNQLYESFRQEYLPGFAQLNSVEIVRDHYLNGSRPEKFEDKKEDTLPNNKLDIIAKKALERLKLSSSIEL